MKLLSFGEPRRERPGILVGERIVDLHAIRPDWPSNWRGVLAAGLIGELSRGSASEAARDLEESAREAAGPKRERGFFAAAAITGQRADMEPDDEGAGGRAVEHVRIGPPIPDASKIIAVGLNYLDHAREQQKEPPAVPLLFAKAPSCLVGPHDPIRLPDPEIESHVDAEAELCVVIGRRARSVSEAEASVCILGYTIMNDVSGRAAQYGDKQWFRGKSFDTFGPCGPWIVTADALPDPTGLALEADWDDRPMQRGNTRDLIHGVPALISYISRMMTLEPGDLISTGTPSGVGVFRDPPVYLVAGERITIRLERVGEISNPVEASSS